MNIQSDDAKLVLLCPAWKNWGTASMVKPGTVILHSRADETVPFADSEEAGLTSPLLADTGIPLRVAHNADNVAVDRTESLQAIAFGYPGIIGNSANQLPL